MTKVRLGEAHELRLDVPDDPYALRDPLLQQYIEVPTDSRQTRQNSSRLTPPSSNPQVRRRRCAPVDSTSATPTTRETWSSERRILDRDAAFCQSRGRWRVQHVSREATRHHHLPGGTRRRLTISKHLWDTWFYSLAYQRTIVLMAILFLTYAAIVFIFASIYYGVNRLGEEQQLNPDGSISRLAFCSMDINNHMEAMYFSLSTMATIGYGVSDYYFGGCWTPFLLVLCQVCCAITFDAVAIGLLFQRISRGHKRGKTVLFSDKAVIQRVNGTLYLMFRLGELRHHQLLESCVRGYCVRHERHPVESIIQRNENKDADTVDTNASDQKVRSELPVETTHFVTRAVRFSHEDVTSHILMSLPQVLVHRIDETSPLLPPSIWYDAQGKIHSLDESPCTLRSSSKNGLALTKSPRDFAEEHLQYVQRFWMDRETEIVVLVEGTDELTGASIQTRHSYTCADLSWNERFVPCVFPYDETEDTAAIGPRSIFRQCRLNAATKPVCVVDFECFHDTVPAAWNSSSSPHVAFHN